METESTEQAEQTEQSKADTAASGSVSAQGQQNEAAVGKTGGGMGFRQALAAENASDGNIILLREGAFWRAYERSAFALVTQVSDFRPVKRAVKALKGQEVVFVGFPLSSEEKFLHDMYCERLEDRMIVKPKTAIDEDAFQKWKASIPLQVSDKLKKNGKADHSPASPGGPPPDGEIRMYSLPEAPSCKSNAEAVVGRLLRYDLASSTPLEAMQFIASLKKMIS